ncbi:MAG: PQQ-binding-like beta-propeller repeat protein [Sedimentisphaerales bacterium]|jgi:outer membrane protein assembly factor BamB
MKKAILVAIVLLLASRGFCNELLVSSQYPIAKATTDAVSDSGPIIVTPYPTIQSAIDAASNGDTVIVMPGIYEGEGNRNISFNGKAITVRSVDPNDVSVVNSTIIDCGWSYENYGFLFGNNEDANSVLDGLTITHAFYDAVLCSNSNPTIRNCNIINNSNGIMSENDDQLGGPLNIINCRITDNGPGAYQGYGGGIYIWGEGAAATIISCDISRNNCSRLGGAIYYYGYCDEEQTGCLGLTIIDCNISANSAGSNGGGIFIGGNAPVIIDNSRILNNRAVKGGGINNQNNTVKIRRSVIAGNVTQSGGAVYVSGGQMDISDSIVSANLSQSDGGGAVYVFYGQLDISDSIVSANSSQSDGGGLYADSSNIGVQRCTVAGNVASGSGGGICTYGSNLSVFNSIFWGNSDSSGTSGNGTSAQIYPTNASVFFSCIQDDDPNDAHIPFGKGPDGFYTGGEENGNIDDNPRFVREPNDGGDGWGVGNNDDYGDLHLRIDSPCIDAGSPLYKGLNATDIDGQPRVIGIAVDMGADEYGKMIVVTKPKPGEVWATGSKHKIQWTQYGVSGVNILLSADNGANWEAIAEGITDANNYLWQLPGDVDSNQCLISVVPSDGDTNVICRKSGLFTISWYPHRPAAPPEWQHKGWLPGPDLSQNKGPQLGCVKWVFDTNGPVSSQVAVTMPSWNSYGVYIGCEDGNIYALDDQGELIWNYDINTPIVGSPAVGYYGMVYAAGQNGELYAIDDYGDLRWTQTTNAPIYSTPVVGYSGKIYVCSEDGLIYALDGDGSELWTFATTGPGKLKGAILATPVIERNGAVYVAGLYEPNLYALDANNGSVKWVCDIGAVEPNKGQIVAPPAIGHDGTIYQTLVNDPNLYAIDPCTGNIIWSTPLRPEPHYYCAPDNELCCETINQYLVALRNHTTPDDCVVDNYLHYCDEGKWQGISALTWEYYYEGSSGWSSPVIGLDGTIYVSFDDPYLRAVEPNGTIKWITRLGMVGGFTLSIDRDGLIYAASDDGYVCVVNADGIEVSRFKGVGWVSFPAITEDGTLFVSDSNNRVWAITNTPCDGQQPVLHWPADVQPSWKVDVMDFATLANNWLECTNPNDSSCISGYGMYAPGDINRDMYVDFADFAAMADKWLMEAN